MYHYLQHRADKKESWHLVDERHIGNLEKPVAFLSILKVDRDVSVLEEAGEDPLDHVKYKGPMYFDLDNSEDIDAVLDSSRQLIEKIVDKLGIDPRYIRCWLSGGKGVHIVIPEQLFGVKRAIKYLPVIYHELAKMVAVDNLDMGVYSAGKGRLWRCPNISRPGAGTYKVSVSLDELRDMDAQGYETLIASPRPEPQPVEPPSNLAVAKAETAFKMAKQAATRRIKAIQNAKTVPVEDVRKLNQTPGCIEKLIKEGDAPTSNWNQAAMQVAAWIAARYEKSEESEYLHDVVEPFVQNVQSSSRPTEKERRKHVMGQINRAFSGRTKFAVGPLIAAIGEPCHECPLCRGDLEFKETPEEGSEEEEPYDPRTRVKASKEGYLLVSDNSTKVLTTWTFWPHTAVRALEESESGEFTEGPREATVGTLVDDNGDRFEDIKVSEKAWQSKSALMAEIGGYGACVVYCGDVEAQKIYRSILQFASRSEEGIDSMTETPVCGIYLERRGKRILPHYIEQGSSIMATRGKGSVPSRFRYRGEKNLSPSLIEEDFPFIDDQELESTLRALFKVNKPSSVAKMAGWFAACHLREHIHNVMPQFPLLGVWGNASAGKTMSALLFAHLTGMDYQSTAEPINMETAKAYPLKRFVSSSTTVPRLVEEVNEKGMRAQTYSETMGVFKAAWNRSTIQRGMPTKNAGVKLQVERVSSPIVYICEQRPNSPAVVNRTVEVMLTAMEREKEDRSKQFSIAYAGRHHLFRAAKAMLQYALTLGLDDVSDLLEAQDHLVPEGLDERPRFSFKVLLAGLQFMSDALLRCDVDVSKELEQLRQALVEDLSDNYKEIDREKRTSEVELALMSIDQMAGEPDDPRCGLVSDDHYIRVGRWLKLDLRRIMPRYRRHCRALGDTPTLSDAARMGELLAGEMYFERFEQHPDRPSAKLHVIDLDKLRDRGTDLVNFEDSAAEYV